MTDTLTSIATNVGALILGQMVGAVSEEVTKRVKLHRQDLGMPVGGAGTGRFETMLDLVLDATIEVAFLMVGINLVEKAIPSIDEDLSAIIMFIVGISTTETHLVSNLKKISSTFFSDSPIAVVPQTE